MKIFLDDYRACPDRFELCRSYEEFTRMVMQNKDDIEVISLDYDLGSIRNGLDACEFLVEKQIKCPKIMIHSDHPNASKMYVYLTENMKESEVIMNE